MDDSRYYKRTIIKEQVGSLMFNQGNPRDVKIYLPPGYNELLTYPAIYCQDGEDFFNFGRIATHANRLILDEGIEPFIVVGVDVDKKIRTSEYAPEGERFEAYRYFFAEELIPYIEGKYPIRRSADERILAGDSLGGSVSVHIALEYPHLFQRVISLSGAFYPLTQARIAKASDLSWLKLYMLIGLDESEVTTDRGTFDFLRFNREAYELLISKRASVRYLEKPGKHLWGFWQNELPEAITYFLG